jgi:hypothetical protein
MFHNNENGSERDFGELGQFQFLSLIPSLVSGAFSVGGALIQSSTAKSIAKQQASTQMSIAQMQTEVQKRWQELELQKIQATTAKAPGEPSVTESLASVIPGSILGVPILYLAIGAGVLFFLSRK